MTAMKTARPLALAMISACLFVSVARAGDDHARIAAAIEGAFRPLAEAHDIPGIAVGVTVAGRRYFFSHGVTSRDGASPVDEHTLFELGSVSKTFTATLGAYAQARGQIDLGDHPSKYMAALEGTALDRATLLELATYTAAGLPLQFPGEVTNGREMQAYFQRFEPPSAPGAMRRYSNPSIGLFGHLVAAAMKRDFADVLEQDLFVKLGLRETHVRIPEERMADYAWGLSRAGKPARVSPGVLDAEAYGVKSTASDLLRFVELNMDASALEAPLSRAIADTHVGYFRVGGMVQGLGWEQYPWPVTLDELIAGNSEDMARKPQPAERIAAPSRASHAVLFNKTGSTNGFSAYAAFVPEHRIGVVMLANRNFPIPDRITATHAVLKALTPAP